MLYLIAALALAMQAAPAPSTAKPPSLEDRMAPQIEAAAQSVREHRPQAALDRLTPVIAAYEADHATETRRIYCGTSMQEAILYAGMGTRDKVGAVVLLPGYCTALYLKGYALVDLGRIAEAKVMYERLLTLAPMDAQYRTEYGQLRAQRWFDAKQRQGRTSANGQAGKRSMAILRGLRRTVSAARSHRKSPENAICSHPTGDVWVSSATSGASPIDRRCWTASAM